MNMVLEALSVTEDSEQTLKEAKSVTEIHSISFSRCRQQSGLTRKKRKSVSGRTWNSVLNKVRVAANTEQFSENESKEITTPIVDSRSFDRRASPRHASDAVVLALNKDDHRPANSGFHPGQKGYAINVSQNGISFASRSAFQLRDELQLTVEDQALNFTLNVAATVVRSTSLDQEFWRIDCKLQSPLSNEQVAHLKEYAPSCYVG